MTIHARQIEKLSSTEPYDLVSTMARFVNSIVEAYAGDFGYDVRTLSREDDAGRVFYWSAGATGTNFSWDAYEGSGVEYDTRNDSSCFVFRGVVNKSPSAEYAILGWLELKAFPFTMGDSNEWKKALHV
jgi:hypothetical protein